MKLTAAHATRPRSGEAVNGDAVVVRSSSTRNLLAVVDALGHGPHAAVAAKRAVDYLESVSLDLELRSILTGMHTELRNTRGAAVMVLVIQDDCLHGCGVGNVELRILGSTIPIVLSPGVVGSNVRQFRFFHGKLRQRSRLVLFSDGISSRFSLETLRHLTPHETSNQLLLQHGRSYDDATALVVDYEA